MQKSYTQSITLDQDEEPQRASEWFEALLVAPSTSSRPGRAVPTFSIEEFPTYEDGKMLLEMFLSTIDATYRILHVPTTRIWLEELYDNVQSHSSPPRTQLAFFLGIYAGAAYVSKRKLVFQAASLNGRTQISLAETWLESAASLLTDPPVPPSIQALQALTHLTHLCTQVEGFNGTFGTVSMLCLHMARSMKIQRLDTSRARSERMKIGADMVEVEIKRRVWWHLVSSDW